MSNKHLQAAPHNQSAYQWWYEEPKGICVVQECDIEYSGVKTIVSKVIPWKAIRRALARKDKK